MISCGLSFPGMGASSPPPLSWRIVEADDAKT
jgi:hypothetical protein